MEARPCARHPETQSRLSCSACETPICPACGVEAAVGYKCPDCAARDASDESDRGVAAGWLSGLGRGSGRGSAAVSRDAQQLPLPIGARATVVGLAASVAGGLVLGPVFMGGVFFLISAGVVGWLVARAVYWATEDRTSPYIRAMALTMAGFTVAVGMVTAGVGTAPAGLMFLAYPAAVYGGWIVVRQR